MANCTSCGIHIPDGQGVCSMCYGDPSYGNDGYYEDMMRREMEQQREREERRHQPTDGDNDE